MSFSDPSASSQPPPGAAAAGGSGEGDPAAASGLDSLASGLAPEIARRVSSIFDAVEHEAEGLRAEAREEAGRYLAEAQRRADDLVRRRQQRISELSDELLQKSEAVVSRLDSAAPVRQGFESLVRALGDAAERLSGELTDPAAVTPSAPPAQTPPAATHAQPPPAAQPPTPAPQATAPPPQFGGPATGPAPGDWNEPDRARHDAIEMAALGATRAEVRARIEPRTGAEAADAILDSIFGAAGDDERVPWTAFGG